jgi:hypothetical protein
MDIVTLAQVVSSITNLLFVVVLAAGYYFTWRVSQTTLQEMRSQHTAMGRPLVIVQEDYESLPELDVAIRNVRRKGMGDLVNAVERIARTNDGDSGQTLFPDSPKQENIP